MNGPTPAGETDARVAALAAQPGQRGRGSRMADRVNERAALDQLIETVRADRSRALVVRADAGMGKTVLLEYLAVRASGLGCRVVRAMGVDQASAQVLGFVARRLAGSGLANRTGERDFMIMKDLVRYRVLNPS